MILTDPFIDYFKSLSALVLQNMTKFQSQIPYYVADDPVINIYEAIRKVWQSKAPIKAVCQTHNLSRTFYYETEERFITYGLPGIFTVPKGVYEDRLIEQLVLMIKCCFPSLTQIGILRIVQAVPATSHIANQKIIAKILTSHGCGFSDRENDTQFWGRIQRTLYHLEDLTQQPLGIRDKTRRTATFFIDNDYYHKRLELLREIFFSSRLKIKKTCMQYNIPISTYYRILEEYRLYGAWAVLDAPAYGKKDSISEELQLKIIREKLAHPEWSGQTITAVLKLKCSRYVVNRVIKRWGLSDKKRQPIVLDRYMGKLEPDPQSGDGRDNLKPACHALSESLLLENYRINRHFQLIVKKMKTRSFHICDPGPLILAPFLNDLGIVQSFHTYGPPKLRGRELTNIALLNIFRILSGYKRINHIRNDGDRSVALASGIGMFGSSSKYYDNTIEFKFEHIHNMKCDVVARAKELGIIEGEHLAFDFHFKEFYGQKAEDNWIGKGPAKAGDLAPGFRPHVAWDLAANVIINIAYFHGGVRSPKIVKQFCEQYIYPVLDPEAIRELYMDSEYTKEADFFYLKKSAFVHGELYVCLKRNRQIDKLIHPALQDKNDWFDFKDNENDEYKLHITELPKTKLALSIVIVRNKKVKDHIRLFASTNTDIKAEELLEKYRYRWIIENGLKDLIASYYLDEISGKDPERIDFGLYCVMVARLTYELFLKELGGKYCNKEDGNKTTLNKLRNLLFEKRNCLLRENSEGDLIITFLEDNSCELLHTVSNMLQRLKDQGQNKVLWWENRGVLIESKDQYSE